MLLLDQLPIFPWAPPSPAPVPIIIETSTAPPTWTYLVPFLAGLATIVAAIIAYRAARVQSAGTVEAAKLKIASDEKAASHAEEADRSRRKAEEERHCEAVRNQMLAFLRGAVASMIVQAKNPGPDELKNEELLQRLHRLGTRCYDLEVLKSLDSAQASALLNAVVMNEALLTHLKPFWKKASPCLEDIKEVKGNCAIAIRRMVDAMALLGHVGDYYRSAADTLEQETLPLHTAADTVGNSSNVAP